MRLLREVWLDGVRTYPTDPVRGLRARAGRGAKLGGKNIRASAGQRFSEGREFHA